MNKRYFDTEDGLTKLLEDCNDVFVVVDDCGQQFMQGIVSTVTDYKDILNKLTGIYMFLEPLHAQAIAYKEIHEDSAYLKIKNETVTTGAKITDQTLKTEAHSSVASFIKVRNILEGYVNACEKGIATCQTQIKRFENDEKYKPLEEK